MSRNKTQNSIPQTIENIEQNYWGDEPSYPSYLVTTVYQLRKKDLNEFTAEDLRILIGQNMSLPILEPMAIDMLEKDILAEGHFYPGDLLHNVLSIPAAFWTSMPGLRTRLKKIFARGQQRIRHCVALSESSKAEFFEQYKDFVERTKLSSNRS